MRYTECRLATSAPALLDELDQNTVHFRPNYDGTREEPVVLPARFPNLLVNGAAGIAVGMATSIPPHNLEEVCTASLRLLDALVEGRQLSNRELCRSVKGPDFPTGGQIVSPLEDIKQVYETGQGTIKMRGTWEAGTDTKVGRTLFITSIPYNVNKATLVERIAEIVTSRSMPHLVDVRDVSTDDVRIELLVKRDADDELVMAYLFKHTPLQSNFSVNLTCLVPTENPEVGRPERLDLHSILWHFLQFRLDVTTRRLSHELGQLSRRIHVLEGFATVFDALDQIIAIIRKSDGKQDAAQKIMARFKLDAEQTDAILELKLYRLARLEILVIQKELAEKRKRAKEIQRLLDEADHKGRWSLVRTDLEDVMRTVGKGDKRRTLILSVENEREITAEDLIVAEDNHVLVTRDGWVKRQKEIKDPSTTRLREGDSVLTCIAGSTRATLVFFSNLGTAYTCRFIDIPATTGYGEPIQKLFKLRDGEGLIAAFSLDSRVIGDIADREGKLPKRYAVAATSDGNGLAFGLSSFVEPSTRAGRRFAKLGDDATVVAVEVIRGKETLIVATREKKALLCAAEEVSFLASAGKGVTLIKLDGEDRVVGFAASTNQDVGLVLKTSLGGEQRITPSKFDVVARGGKGKDAIKRGQFVEMVPPPVSAPTLPGN
jgi:DNA gyrase subunit A